MVKNYLRLFTALLAMTMLFGVNAFAAEVDYTSKVKTDKASWNTGGGPVNMGGISMPEHFQNPPTIETGDIMYQTVTDLPNGTYKAVLYATACSTHEREGFTSDVTNGSEAHVYVYANTVQVPVKALVNTAMIAPGEYTLENIEVTDGTLKLGMAKYKNGTNWHTIQIKSLVQIVDNFPAYEAALALANETAAKEMFSSAKTALDAVIAANKDLTASSADDAIIAATEALNNAVKVAEVSIKSFEIVKNGFANSVDGWTCTTGNAFKTNTWSNEGNSDGTNVTTPFMEDWTDKSGVLGNGSISRSLEGVDNGYYTVTALVRVYSEAGNDITSGITMGVNGTTLDLATAGTAFTYNNMKGVYGEFSVTGKVEDGKLSITFNITDAKFNWLAIKNVKVTYLGSTTPEEGALNVALEAAKAVDVTALNTGASKALADAIAAAETVDRTNAEAMVAATNVLNTAIKNAEAIAPALVKANALITECEEVAEKSTTDDEANRTALTNAIATAKAAVDAAADAAAMTAAVDALEAARQTYVQVAYPAEGYAFDMTFLVKNADITKGKESWTTEGTVGTNAGEHWSGVSNLYIEPCDWNATGWTSSFKQTTTVPAGIYKVQVAFRASEGVTADLIANDSTYRFKSIGAVGGTIATDGTEWESVAAGIAAGKTFAKNNECFGWVYGSINNLPVKDGSLTIGGTATTTAHQQWTSFDDFKVYLTGSTVAKVSSIAEIKALANQDEFVFALKDVKVTVVEMGRMGQTIFVEDATGGIQLSNMEGMIPEEFSIVGNVVNGTLKGRYINEFGIVAIAPFAEGNTLTATAGTLTPATVTVADAKKTENYSRLVKVEKVNLALDGAYYVINGTDSLQLVDQWRKLAYDADGNMVLGQYDYIQGLIIDADGVARIQPTNGTDTIAYKLTKIWEINDSCLVQVGDVYKGGQQVTSVDGMVMTFGSANSQLGDGTCPDFKAGKADSHIEGFVAFTEGTGENPKGGTPPTNGTFYTFEPSYEGEVTVGVVLNTGKQFYVYEDGVVMPEFNGIRLAEKYYGTYTFPVKGGSKYIVYCSGSKLGYYGFVYSHDKAALVPAAGLVDPMRMGLTIEKGKNDTIKEARTIKYDDFDVIIGAKAADAAETVKDNMIKRSTSNAYSIVMNSGTITFKAAEGKAITKIAIPSRTATVAKVTANVGEYAFAGSAGTWTGEAEEVVLTFDGVTLTTMTVGDYVAPTIEVADIAAIKKLYANDLVKLSVNGAIVNGVAGTKAYIQDATGAIKLNGLGVALNANKTITGTIYGKVAVDSYDNYTLVKSDASATSEVTEADAIVTPVEVGTLENLTAANVFQLVALNDVKLKWDADWEEGSVTQGEITITMDDAFGLTADGYNFPSVAERVVGIIEYNYGDYVFAPISKDSIKAGVLKFVEVKNIAEVKTLANGTNFKMNLEGLKVTKNAPGMGWFSPATIIVEDASGAIELSAGETGLELPEPITAQGNVVKGQLIATYAFDMMMNVNNIQPNDSTVNSTLTVDSGAVIKPTVMTIADAKKPENNKRYIMVKNVDFTIDAESYATTITDGEETIDIFDKWNCFLETDENGEYIIHDKYAYIMGIAQQEGETFMLMPSNVVDTIKPYKVATVPVISEEAIYFWESPDGVVYEKGGKAESVNVPADASDRVNYANADYYTICLNGKKANMNDTEPSNNATHIVITLDEALAWGDVMNITAYRNKNEDKEANIYFDYGTVQVSDTQVFGNIGMGEQPTTNSFDIPQAAAGQKVIKLSRNKAGTNVFITKIEILRDDNIPDGINDINAVVDVLNGDVYSVNGVKVRNAGESLNGLKGLYIINGKKVVIK